MKYTALFSLTLVGTLVLLPDVAAAQNLGFDLVSNAANTAGFAEANETTFATTLGRVIRIALSFVGVIFTLLTVYAGFLWMTARGNESQVEQAKKTLQNALIGLVIAIASYSITGFVIRAIETGSPVNTPTTDSDTDEDASDDESEEGASDE